MRKGARLAWGAAAGGVALAAFLLRGMALAHAAVLAVAVSALGYATLDTADRLRELWRGPSDRPPRP